MERAGCLCPREATLPQGESCRGPEADQAPFSSPASCIRALRLACFAQRQRGPGSRLPTHSRPWQSSRDMRPGRQGLASVPLQPRLLHCQPSPSRHPRGGQALSARQHHIAVSRAEPRPQCRWAPPSPSGEEQVQPADAAAFSRVKPAGEPSRTLASAPRLPAAGLPCWVLQHRPDHLSGTRFPTEPLTRPLAERLALPAGGRPQSQALD